MSNHPSNEYGTSYGYSRLHRRIEWSAIIAFALLNAGLVSLTALRIQEAPLWGSVTAVVFFVLSWLAADWVGGFVHWAADNYGEESWPLIGHGLIRPFREHHVDPQALCRHDLVELNGNCCLVSLPVLLIAFVPVFNGPVAMIAWVSLLAGLCFWVFLTNIIHAWAHLDSPPRIARVLQRTGLILSPEHHEVHHTAPHTRNYCITCGVMNPVLERVRFFRFAERVLFLLTGAHPLHHDASVEPSSAPSQSVGTQ